MMCLLSGRHSAPYRAASKARRRASGCRRLSALSPLADIRIDLAGRGNVCVGARLVAHLLLGDAAIVESRGVLRIDLERSVVVLDGMVKLAFALIEGAAHGQGRRIVRV